MVLHSIGRSGPPAATSAFIRKYIFPGGYIPALSEVLPAIEKAGLMVTDIEILRLHYAETLKHWRERFAANRDKAKAIYDERFCRMWEFYLAASEAAFRWQDLMVFQIQLAKRNDTLPLTRDYIGQMREGARHARDGAPSDRAALPPSCRKPPPQEGGGPGIEHRRRPSAIALAMRLPIRKKPSRHRRETFFMTYLLYIAAALAEIAGCFSFWAWWRLESRRSGWRPASSRWSLSPGCWRWSNQCRGPRLCRLWRHLHRGVAGLAVAGRRRAPRPLGLVGAALCIVGASVILLAPRGA